MGFSSSKPQVTTDSSRKSHIAAAARLISAPVPIKRQQVRKDAFNQHLQLPFELRSLDFEAAMQDVYDFFYDVNTGLTGKGLKRLDDSLRQAIMSGMLSDMLTSSLDAHSRTLTTNLRHNGHPDLILDGRFPGNSVQHGGTDGVEIKTTRKRGGAVDTHGAREQWMCVFVYEVDNTPGVPYVARQPMRFTEVYIAHVTLDDFRRNERGELGTRTATLHAEGVAKLRQSWVYLDPPRPEEHPVIDVEEVPEPEEAGPRGA